MNKEVIEIDINSILYTHLKERTLIQFNHWGIDIDGKELTPKTNLKDLGLDSLDITMIIFFKSNIFALNTDIFHKISV